MLNWYDGKLKLGSRKLRLDEGFKVPQRFGGASLEVQSWVCEKKTKCEEEDQAPLVKVGAPTLSEAVFGGRAQY